jgi:hypothetical protein
VTDRKIINDLDFQGVQKVKNAVDPTSAQDYATKQYVDDTAGGGGVVYGTPAILLGTAAANGATNEAIRRDATILAFDATNPTTQAFGDSAATGSAGTAARRDHKHAMPATPTTVSGNAGTATALQTARTINGVSFDGTANITNIAEATHAASSKTTPVDADELALVDSAASNVLKKLTGTNLKAYLKAYFDTLYASVSGSGVVEYDYVENTSSTISCSGASAAAASAIIDGNAVTYDGSTRIKIEFGCYSINNGGIVELYDGSTDLGRMGFGNSGLCFYASRILTPSAAAHTFHIKGWRTTGTNMNIDSGSGGTGAVLPAWYRITKA